MRVRQLLSKEEQNRGEARRIERCANLNSSSLVLDPRMLTPFQRTKLRESVDSGEHFEGY